MIKNGYIMIKIGTFDVNYQELIVNFLDNIRDNYMFCDYHIGLSKENERMFTLYMNEEMASAYIRFDINNYMGKVIVKKGNKIK